MPSILQRTSLFFKVIVATSLILIVAISFNVWWNTNLHEASIERMTHEKTKIIAEFIENNVVRAMERGRHFDMHQILRNYLTYIEIKKIVLISLDGTIKASTRDEVLESKIEDVDSYLKNQYFVREETVHLGGGKTEKERIFYFNNPIANRPECYQCHSKKNKIIGVSRSSCSNFRPNSPFHLFV